MATCVAAAVGLVGFGSTANAAPLVQKIQCTSASAWQIVPTGLGATYTITNGAGYCLQGAPYQGDWSVTYTGSGSATVFTCTPLGGAVSGLVLNMVLQFHNNRTGANATVNETWTQNGPVAPLTFTNLKINPGNTTGLLETHVFNQCPPGGTPSAYVQWNDANGA